jgi:hypothetical protein
MRITAACAPRSPSADMGSEGIVLPLSFRGLLLSHYGLAEGVHCFPGPLAVEHFRYNGRQREVPAHYSGQILPLWPPHRAYLYCVAHIVNCCATPMAAGALLSTGDSVQELPKAAVPCEDLHQVKV